MINKFDRRIQMLFETNEEIRRAEVAGDIGEVRKTLTHGLTDSCLLLQDMVGDELLRKLCAGHDAGIV